MVLRVVLEVGNDVLEKHAISVFKFHITPEFGCRLTRLHGVTTQFTGICELTVAKTCKLTEKIVYKYGNEVRCMD